MIKPITLGVVMLSLLYIAIDFSNRFVTDAHQLNKAANDFVVNEKQKLPQLNAVQQLALTNAYRYYQPEEKKEVIVEKVLGLSDKQKLAQQGELIEFYDGDWRYRLIAVISPDGGEQALKTPIALLLARNVKDVVGGTNQNNKKAESLTKLTRVGHGSILGLFDVSITSTQQVNFLLNERKITLLMYQPANKKAQRAKL